MSVWWFAFFFSRNQEEFAECIEAMQENDVLIMKVQYMQCAMHMYENLI